MGTSSRDDAAIYRLSDDLALVQTVDFFPPVVDDPRQFGAIAVANALSDVYAMGGTPLTALNLLCFPVDLDREVLAEILEGAYAKAQEAGVLIVGGHTIDDEEPKFGLAVTGTVHPQRFVTLASARPGDVLVLTKPIGTGIITTAGKNGVVDSETLETAIQSMLILNRDAAQAMVAVGVNACTDITGFGLLGHLQGMVQASHVGANLTFSQIPLLPGALKLVEQGIAPGGTHRNFDAVGRVVDWAADITAYEQLLLCDAQTSGGLLMAVPQERADSLIAALRKAGIAEPAVIGHITEDRERRISVVR